MEGKLSLNTMLLWLVPNSGWACIRWMKSSYMKKFYVDDWPRADLGIISLFLVLAVYLSMSSLTSSDFVATMTSILPVLVLALRQWVLVLSAARLRQPRLANILLQLQRGRVWCHRPEHFLERLVFKALCHG